MIRACFLRRFSPSFLILAAALALALAAFLAPGARPAQAQDAGTAGNCRGTDTMTAAEQHADLLWRMTNQGQSEASARQQLERFCTGLSEMFERFPTGLQDRERILWRGTIWIGNVFGLRGCHDRVLHGECPDDAVFTLQTASGLDSPYKIRSIRAESPTVHVTFTQAIPQAYQDRLQFWAHAPFTTAEAGIGDGRAWLPAQVGAQRVVCGSPCYGIDNAFQASSVVGIHAQGLRLEFGAVDIDWSAGQLVSVALTLAAAPAGQQQAPPGITVTAATPLGVSEDGSGTYTVVLDREPVADVTLTATSSDTGAVSVSPASHTFTPSNWHEPATFTVSGVADDDTNDESVGVSHAVTSQDSRYQDVLVPSVQVTVSDTTQEQGQRQGSDDGEYADLIADVSQWRNDPAWVDDKTHTDRWDRVLLALGEEVTDTTLTPMTAAEAQELADRGWQRWVRVAEALTEIESAGQQQQETPNSAPTVSGAIADATIVNESGTQQVSLSGVYSDADGDDLTITAQSSDDATATVSVSSDQSTLTVTAKARGTATVTVTADDGNGGTVADAFTVTVKAAPVVASAIADVSGLTAGTTQDVSLSGVFSDADGDALTITASSSDTARATVSVSSDGSTLTLAGVAEGTATITVTAEDADGNRVSDAFEVAVAPTNSVPTVSASIADATIVNESGTQQVSLSGVFSDADGDDLTITAQSSDDATATVSVSSDQSTLTVTAKARGTATVTVTSDDGNGGTVADSFTVTVKAAPVVASAIADATMTIESVLDVSLKEVFNDADGDALTVTAASSDRSVAEAILFLGTLTLLSVKEGSVTITVTAEDADGNRVSDAFDVAVTPTNSVPTVSASIADATIVNESGTQQVSLSGVFSDADNDALTVTAASSDTGKATVSVAADQSALTVSAQARGTATVTVTASDGNGGTVADSFTVTVKAAPTVASAIADVSGLEAGSAQDVSLSGVFSDADGDALTVTAASADTGKATVTVAADQSKLMVTGIAEGTATITVTAQDADGNRVSDAFEVSVAPEQKDSSALIAKVREWRNDPQWVDNKTHTDRWDRVLVALGETVADTSLTAMTAAEAQTYADRGWQRWVEVVEALREIESG